MSDDGERIGILSDTHGQAEAAGRAARLLLDRGVARAFHCGDIGTDRVIDALAELRMTYVFGNTDYDREVLGRYIRAVGASFGEPFARCEMNGKVVAVTHGDRPRVMQQLLDDGVDYLLHGHTHERRNEQVGVTRVINPGALHRAAAHTVAILSPASGQLAFLEVD